MTSQIKNKISGIVTLSFINLFCIFFIPGCYYDNADSLYPGSNQPVNCATVPAKFGEDISPLITAKCATAGCHNTTAAGGIILQNYTQISAAKNRINVRAVIEKSMPSSGPLSISEINSIKCWIESGAPNN